jgi:hypothetical protein
MGALMGALRFKQRIMRTVHQYPLVHCYLACGHMITVDSGDINKSPSPSAIECWACKEESKKANEKGFPLGR